MNKLVLLAVVPIFLLLAAVPNAYAGDADCDTDPNENPDGHTCRNDDPNSGVN